MKGSSHSIKLKLNCRTKYLARGDKSWVDLSECKHKAGLGFWSRLCDILNKSLKGKAEMAVLWGAIRAIRAVGATGLLGPLGPPATRMPQHWAQLVAHTVGSAGVPCFGCLRSWNALRVQMKIIRNVQPRSLTTLCLYIVICIKNLSLPNSSEERKIWTCHESCIYSSFPQALWSLKGKKMEKNGKEN